MKKIQVGFSFRYDRCELSAGEHLPEIFAYLDARFIRKPLMVQFNLDENDPNKVYKGQVEGYINQRVVSSLPPTTALVFRHYAWRPNEWGAPSLEGVGSNHVTLGELTSKEKFSKSIPLLMHTVNNLEKGQIHFELDHLELDGLDVGGPLFVETPMKAAKVVEACQQYINQTMEMERAMQDTAPDTNNIRVPCNLSESGLEMTSGMPLPAFSYALHEIPQSNQAFWENALKQVLKRDGLIPADFFALNVDGQARVMANVACYVPTQLNYVSDTVLTDNRLQKTKQRMQQVGIELFGDSLGPCRGGDCEDLGSGIQMCHEALQLFEFKGNSLVVDALKEVQKISRQYISVLSLDWVAGAKVGDHTSTGAHINTNMHPIHQFRQALENTQEGKQLARNLPWPEQEKKYANLPFMVCEGTGIYEPLGLDTAEPLVPVTAYVYQNTPSLSGDKKPITHKRNEKTPFFQGSLNGFTNYFYRRGFPYVGFWYTNEYGSRGALYEHMVQNRIDKWGFRPHPKVSPTLAKLVNEAILVRQPPLPLTLTSGGQHPAQNEHLEFIKNYVADLKRTSRPSTSTNLIGVNGNYRGVIEVPVYIRPENLSAKLARATASEFQRLEHVVSVNYDLEEATDNVYCYRLMVSVAV